MVTDSITLIAPYPAPAAIGPRATRSRRLAAALATTDRPVHPIVVADPSLAGPVLAAAPGPLVGAMVEPGMGARLRLRASVARGARRLLPLPDAHLRWAAAVLRAPALARPPSPRTVIYAVAAPLSSVLVAAQLGRRWGAPVISDLGDPWFAAGPAEAHLASRTLRRLDALIVANAAIAAACRPQLVPGASVLVAASGADLLRRSAPVADEPPLFLQLGTLSGARTDPAPAFRALAELDRRGLIRFRSYGEAWVRLPAAVAGHHRGILGERDARELMGSAAAIAVVGNRNTIQIPSKVYEIARSQAWGLYASEHDPRARRRDPAGQRPRPGQRQRRGLDHRRRGSDPRA